MPEKKTLIELEERRQTYMASMRLCAALETGGRDAVQAKVLIHSYDMILTDVATLPGTAFYEQTRERRISRTN